MERRRDAAENDHHATHLGTGGRDVSRPYRVLAKRPHTGRGMPRPYNAGDTTRPYYHGKAASRRLRRQRETDVGGGTPPLHDGRPQNDHAVGTRYIVSENGIYANPPRHGGRDVSRPYRVLAKRPHTGRGMPRPYNAGDTTRPYYHGKAASRRLRRQCRTDVGGGTPPKNGHHAARRTGGRDVSRPYQ